jgi:hypothetical protein
MTKAVPDRDKEKVKAPEQAEGLWRCDDEGRDHRRWRKGMGSPDGEWV